MKTQRMIYIFIITAFIMALFVISSTPVKAASKQQEALQAYAELLSGSTIYWDSYNNAVPLSKCDFNIALVDKDDIPELIIGGDVAHWAGIVAIYTYRNGKVVRIGILQDDFCYYPKKNLFASEYLIAGSVLQKYYTISGTKAKCILKQGWYNDGYKKKNQHYWKCASKKEKEISKKQFTKLLKKRAGKTKLKTLKFVMNTVANRKKILGYQ